MNPVTPRSAIRRSRSNAEARICWRVSRARRRSRSSARCGSRSIRRAATSPRRRPSARRPTTPCTPCGTGSGRSRGPSGAARSSRAQGVRALNALQRRLVEGTRLGIPAIAHEEALTGFMTAGATQFPSPLNYGATWDPDLIRRVADEIRRQMRAAGTHQALAPVADVARDARWGRIEETVGEDPFLVGSIVSAYVEGLQGADLRDGIVATLKHFCGYSGSEGGRNFAPLHAGPRELADVFLLPFEMAVKQGGRALGDERLPGRGRRALRGVARAAHRDAARALGLRRDRRRRLLRRAHAAPAPPRDGGAGRVRSGCTRGGSRRGAAALGVLRARARRGARSRARGRADARPGGAARAAAQVRARALRGALRGRGRGGARPSRGARAGARGGGALDRAAPERRGAAARGGGRAHRADRPERRRSDGAVRELLRSRTTWPRTSRSSRSSGRRRCSKRCARGWARTGCAYAQGCRILRGPGSSATTAPGSRRPSRCARDAALAVLVVGDKAGHFRTGTVGEGTDTADLSLPGVQGELVEAVLATGTPTVVVLVNGRPFDLTAIAPRAAAIVEAWFPGQDGAAAIAAVLAGDVDPSGRTSLGFARGAGAMPRSYDHKPLGGRGAAAAGLRAGLRVRARALLHALRVRGPRDRAGGDRDGRDGRDRVYAAEHGRAQPGARWCSSTCAIRWRR